MSLTGGDIRYHQGSQTKNIKLFFSEYCSKNKSSNDFYLRKC